MGEGDTFCLPCGECSKRGEIITLSLFRLLVVVGAHVLIVRIFQLSVLHVQGWRLCYVYNGLEIVADGGIICDFSALLT